MTKNKTQKKDGMGNRLKSYEAIWGQQLPIRTPVIMRLDGKSFHTYTRNCTKPFDPNLEEVMNTTAIELCKMISGAQIAYVQSDEISILIHTYKTINTQAWFDNQVQKMCSISAALASTTFTMNSGAIWGGTIKPALFDSRVFIVPESEVNNVFTWRMKDAIRNSINSVGQAHFSQKQLHGKNIDDVLEMLKTVNVDWSVLPFSSQRGRCVVKNAFEENGTVRNKWIIDDAIPKFWEDKEYINRFLKTEE